MSRTVTLSVLDSISVASPCTADWNGMAGNDRVRFCSDCRLNVYNISAMTRNEAEALILSTEGHLCARLYRRPDGTILTRDCPVGLRAVRAKVAAGIARIAAATAFLIGGVLTLGAGRPVRLREVQPFSTICEWISPTPPAVAGRLVIGEVCAPPVPTPKGNGQ